MADIQSSFKLVAAQFASELELQAKEVGYELSVSLEAVRDYTAGRMEHLSQTWGQAGFTEAVKAEIDNVLYFSLETSMELADAADARIVGLAQMALSAGARIVAGGVA